jgi:DNA (cytosine-5)-methyltransferase 1
VHGFAYRGKDEGLARILSGIEQINRESSTNYRPCWKVIDAADYGVPQHRERIFVIASRDGRAFDFPPPTHGGGADLFGAVVCEPYRTAWDALGDLPQHPNDQDLRVSGKWAELLPSIPEGENYLWHTPRGKGRPLFGWRTRYWSFLLKLAKERPSWTIQAQPGSAIGPFHWCNRKLSVQELCRLQTFPDALSFDCGRTQAQRLLGNAVPSLVAEVLAREIRVQLLDSTPTSKRLRLLPPRRKNMAPPEPVAPVPGKYLTLQGNHAEHPGEGRGNGARARIGRLPHISAYLNPS